jgi:hypothetical protein
LILLCINIHNDQFINHFDQILIIKILKFHDFEGHVLITMYILGFIYFTGGTLTDHDIIDDKIVFAKLPAILYYIANHIYFKFFVFKFKINICAFLPSNKFYFNEFMLFVKFYLRVDCPYLSTLFQN